MTPVRERREDLRCIIMRRIIKQRDQYGEEPKRMQNQDKPFDLWQYMAYSRVNEDCKKDRCPENQDKLPGLGDIIGVVQNQEALNH